MFYGINGRICRVVDTRSERDEVLRDHGGTSRSFFLRSNAEFYAENGVTIREDQRLRAADAAVSRNVAVTVFTDGACSSSQRGTFAGAGVWFGHGSADNISKIVPAIGGVSPTNQRAELMAILEAVRVAAKREYRALSLHTDSIYCINLMKNLDRHSFHQFLDSRGLLMKNGDLLRDICEVKEGADLAVVLRHVYGHSGIEGNEEADRLAVEARLRAEVEAMRDALLLVGFRVGGFVIN